MNFTRSPGPRGHPDVKVCVVLVVAVAVVIVVVAAAQEGRRGYKPCALVVFDRRVALGELCPYLPAHGAVEGKQRMP